MLNSTAFGMIILFAVILLSGCTAQCPDTADTVHPCVCTADGQGRAVMSCEHDLSLPRLTTILRREMCGHYLDRFEMRKANVTYLPSNLFYRTPVKDISISHMSITRFTEAGTSAFQGLEEVLESLSMRYCALVDGLQWQMIGPMRALTQLDLSHNNLTRIPSEWFRAPPPNLRSLVLRGNRISSIDPGAMTSMHKLVQLDLSENRISSLTRNVLPRPGNALIFLSLSYNRLESVPEDLFDELMGIRRIYLDNNLIKILGAEETWSPVWGDLDVLDVSGNLLECSCEALWVSELRPPRLLYGQCEAPDDLHGVLLKNLVSDHFEWCHATTGSD